MTGNIQTFDFSVDLLQAILWQYNDAVRLQTLLQRKSDWYETNQRDFWTSWISDVFDLRTANDFGLAVWAQILNVPLVAATPVTEYPVFGFAPDAGQPENGNLNFERGNFGQDTDGTVGLNTEQKRLLLRLRYFQITSTGAAPEINAAMTYVFGELGGVHVLDAHDMTMQYVFDFVPPSNVLFVLQNFDVLPRPAGVELTVSVTPGDRFGFAPYYLNFERSNFRGG